MARGPQPVGRERVAKVAQLRFRRPGSLDDLGAEGFPAEAGVLVGLGAAQPVRDVQRRGAVAELSEGVPETGRVRTARDETGDVAARLDQALLADVRLDALAASLQFALERGRRNPVLEHVDSPLEVLALEP